MGANESRICLGPSSDDVKRYRELEKERDNKASELRNEVETKRHLETEFEKLKDEFKLWKQDNADTAGTIERLRNFEQEVASKNRELEAERLKSAEVAKFLEEETHRLADLQVICNGLMQNVSDASRREETARIDFEAREREFDEKERQILQSENEKRLAETRFSDLMKRWIEQENALQEAKAIITDKETELAELRLEIENLTQRLRMMAESGNAADNSRIAELVAQIEQSQKLAENKERSQGTALAAFQAAKALRSEEEQNQILQEMAESSRKAAEELLSKERELMQREKERIEREKEGIEQARDRERREMETERDSFNMQLKALKERGERIEQEKEKLRAECEREKEAMQAQIGREREKIKVEKERLKDVARAYSYESDVNEKPHLTLTQLYSIKMTIISASNLVADPKNKRNPYCMVHICNKDVETAVQKRATQPAKGTLEPVWNQVFGFITEKEPDFLQFDVWDFDEATKDAKMNLGTTVLELHPFYHTDTNTFEGSLDLIYKEAQIGSIKVKLECRVVPQTAFRWMGGFDHAEIARVINNAHADVQTKEMKYGRTPLSTAAFKNHFHIAKVLMLAKADPNIPDNEGLTPLLLSAIYGHAKTMQVLIEAGADLEARDSNLRTALMHACKTGNTEAASVLIKNGANLEAVDAENLTPLMLATAEGQLECMKLLIENKANLEASNPNKITALIIAAIRDQAEAARLLLEAGASPHACDVHGLNALMVAAVRGNVHATASLLKFGADVESTDSQFGRTPLMYAAHGGNVEVAQLLLDHKASVTAVDKDNRTALDIAMDNQHRNMLLLLQDRQPVQDKAMPAAILSAPELQA